MRRRPTLIALLVASTVVAACGGDNKVGDERILDFKEQAQQRLGETTTTAAPLETTAPPATTPGGKAGLGATTAPPTTAPATTTTAAPVVTTTTERKQAVFEIQINSDNAGAAQFDPSASRVFVGTAVRFTNRDVEPRSVQADNGSFQSPSIAPGQSWTYNATTAGKFNFHDGTRPYAVGSIEVLPR